MRKPWEHTRSSTSPAHLGPVDQSPPQRKRQHTGRAERSNAFDDSQAANGPVVAEQKVRLESDGQRRGRVVGGAATLPSWGGTLKDEALRRVDE